LTARHAKPEEIQTLAEWEQELLAAGIAAAPAVAEASIAEAPVVEATVVETPAEVAAPAATETTETAKDAE
jgi:hypothetical protein